MHAFDVLGDPVRRRILELLEAYPYPWSLKLARTVIGSLKRQEVTSTRWRLAQDLPKFGLRMPPEFTEDLVSGWPKRPGWDPWINKFTAVMRFRKEIMEAL